MSEFFTPAGLSDLQGYESSGNPTAQNSTSSASGLYGFIDSTWAQYAPQVGVDTSVYPTAASAPPEVQSQVASITPVSNWTCPGCDAGITGDIASNPSLVSSSPMSGLSFSAPPSFNPATGNQDFSGGVAGSGFSFNSIAGGALSNGAGELGPIGSTGSGSTSVSGALGGAASGAASWWTEAELAVENFAMRGALILIGIVLLAAAAFAMSHKADLKGLTLAA